MEYEPTTSSAISFANEDRLEEWVHLFLCNEGGNIPFSEGLKLEPRHYYPPKLMNLNDFKRCCGPEDGIKFQISADGFYKNVNNIAKRFKNGDWDMPPLIVNRFNGELVLNDGNHRYEALKQMNITEYWVIIWETIV